MLDQTVFDEVADLLVEQGIRVTYASLNDLFKERDRLAGGPGRGKSDRDLQDPFADWKRRRRYRPYLAHLNLPEDMDKAIATFVDRAMTIARKHAASTPSAAEANVVQVTQAEPAVSQQLADVATSLQRQMSALAEEYRTLRDQVAAPPTGQQAAPALKREDRRRGLAAAAGRFFWDRMMLSFVEVIRERGPMTAAELLDTLDDDALAMARAAFEEVTVSVIKEKVEYRIEKKNYFRMTADGRYDVLPKHAARAKRI